jgi:hypothetical protein
MLRYGFRAAALGWIIAALVLLAPGVGLAIERAGVLRRGCPPEVRTVHPMGYEGQYEYGLESVARFRWGYFGAHSRPTSAWSRGYFDNYSQWTYRPGS